MNAVASNSASPPRRALKQPAGAPTAPVSSVSHPSTSEPQPAGAVAQPAPAAGDAGVQSQKPRTSYIVLRSQTVRPAHRRAVTAAAVPLKRVSSGLRQVASSIAVGIADGSAEGTLTDADHDVPAPVLASESRSSTAGAGASSVEAEDDHKREPVPAVVARQPAIVAPSSSVLPGARILSAKVHFESGHFGFAGPDNLLQDTADMWCSMLNQDLKGAPWVAFDLQSPASPTHVLLRSRALPNGVRAFGVQSSEVGSNDWVQRARFEVSNSGAAQTFAISAPDVKARYWRLVFLKNYGEARPTYSRFFVEYVAFLTCESKP